MNDQIQGTLKSAWNGALGLSLLLLLLLAPSGAFGACSNEAFRGGKSGGLPDCRAYELVTPATMDGRIPKSLFSAVPYDMFPVELASPSRDSVLYMTLGGPISDPAGANGTYDLYESERTEWGWRTTRRLSPSGEQAVFPNAGGVSSDHWYDFTNVYQVEQTRDGGTLAEEGISNYLGNPDGTFEPIGVGGLGVERFAQGRYISPGGDHIIFTTGNSGSWCALWEPCPILQLEPNAPPTGTGAVYDRSADGPTHVVSLLPGEVTPGADETAEYQGASPDGSVVAFKVSGKLYVRVDNEVTKEVPAAGETTFAGISGNGQWIFYVSGGNISAYDISSGVLREANSTGDAEVANVSGDGSHVYFVSPSELVPGEGTAGEPNLYVWRLPEGKIDFVATVSSSDIGGIPGLSNWTSWVVNPDNSGNPGPGAESSRTTPDGTLFAFESRAKLTSYENEGRNAIYLYDDEAKSLECVSCNPSGDPPTADAEFESVFRITPPMVIHNLTTDGSMVFFETNEALIGRDTDGVNDIYEWKRGTAGSGPTLSLISSGQSKAETVSNNLFAVTPRGGDVIFTSSDRLVPAAPGGGAVGLYDARVGGGFQEPVPTTCSGDACQRGNAPPSLTSPASSRFKGKGNVKRRCRRARHHRARSAPKRCVRRHQHRKQHHARNETGRFSGGVAK